MEVDYEIGRRLWPGLGGQPQAAPQPAAPEQTPQALHAQPKEAETVRRFTPDTAGGVRRQAGATPTRWASSGRVP